MLSSGVAADSFFRVIFALWSGEANKPTTNQHIESMSSLYNRVFHFFTIFELKHFRGRI